MVGGGEAVGFHSRSGARTGCFIFLFLSFCFLSFAFGDFICSSRGIHSHATFLPFLLMFVTDIFSSYAPGFCHSIVCFLVAKSLTPLFLMSRHVCF